MAAIPGGAGMPFVGDKSVEFYRDIINFANKRIEQHNSRVFLSRLLNKPTVFVASNNGVKELLNDHTESVELGYKAFMHQIYGDNVIFADGAEATSLRDSLKSLLTSHDSVRYSQEIINRQTKKHLDNIANGSPLGVYEVFKRLATEICLSLFLGVNFESSTELANTIVSLTTTHWHGIISVPINLSIPGLSRSTFSKALEAKGKLLDIICQKVSNSTDAFPQMARHTGFHDDVQVANHLLLFTSALVPKAIASLLTSFVLETANEEKLQRDLSLDPDLLEWTLLETQRLWPPLVGGRRVAKNSFRLGDLRVPEGHALVYLTHHAHRDPEVFSDPDKFMPTRWQHQNADDRDKLFVFGSGSRDCVGKHIVWYILKTVCGGLLDRYTWHYANNAKPQYKWLPVARPKDSVKVTFQEKGQGQGTQGQDDDKTSNSSAKSENNN